MGVASPSSSTRSSAGRIDVDVAAQVPHGALRFYVMGERGARREAATGDDIAAMARIAPEGIEAGALGFTTSRTLNHRTSKGEPTPTLTADADELVGIARAIGETGNGVLQGVSDFTDVDAEFAIFRRMVEASGRPLSFSLVQVRGDRLPPPTRAARPRRTPTGVHDDGPGRAAPVGILLGLECTLNPLLANRVRTARSACCRSPSGCAVMSRSGVQGARARSRPRRSTKAQARRAHHPAFDRMFELGDPPDYEPDAADEHRGAGEPRGPRTRSSSRTTCCSRDDGRSFLYLPFLNYADGNLDAVGEMLAHPNTVIGLGDGGAHVGTICDASFPTTLLTHWVRDRVTAGSTFRSRSSATRARPRAPSACSTAACSRPGTAPTST